MSGPRNILTSNDKYGWGESLSAAMGHCEQHGDCVFNAIDFAIVLARMSSSYGLVGQRC